MLSVRFWVATWLALFSSGVASSSAVAQKATQGVVVGKIQGFQCGDNCYLTITLEYGVLGLVLYLLFLGTAVYLALRAVMTVRSDDPEAALLAPLGIALVNFMFIKSVFSDESNHSLVFMMLAATMVLLSRVKNAPRMPFFGR